MALLQLHGAGLRLSWRRGRWRVTRGDTEVRSVRPREVTEIQLLGPTSLSPGARAAALARGIPVVFLTADGRYRGRLEGPRGPAGALRLAQARWLGDPHRRLELARAIVDGKVGTARTLLLSRQRQHPAPELAGAASALRELRGRLDRAATVDALRGYEGEGAARYFSVWGVLLRNEAFSWSGRSRRPPRDPVNACLSYLYTLLAVAVEDAVRAVGLLPDVGALHEPGPGRLPLVYDLVEEFRAPLVDRMVLRLINRRQVAPEDFEDPSWRRPTLPAPTVLGGEQQRSSGAVYLGATARRLLSREFAGALRGDLRDEDDGASLRARWLLERQARRVARLVRGEEDRYRPFRWGAK